MTTEQLIEKAKDCKSEEDFSSLLKGNYIEVSDEHIHHVSSGIGGIDSYFLTKEKFFSTDTSK